MTIDFNDKRILEKYSSTFTLTDMELFIFPELLYPLVIANIMSPIIWQWKLEDWFKGIEKKSETYKIHRIKQFIMDHYVFNLDLETWGLTTKEKEMERFKDLIPLEALAQSNALFGYEGDKYYFDIDIRKHFGLEKYQSNVIPYWKTETVEAMTAFKHKAGFTTGAGECVSLAALYAAALFIIGKIPLEKIFLISTPLHSQNFLNIGEGILTNNRRIVTKNMWFNGTTISKKARRALENEKISIVSHVSGYIHTIYDHATIDSHFYEAFTLGLSSFVKADASGELFLNFLRQNPSYQACFQVCRNMNGERYYIELQKIYEQEISSKNSFSGKTRDNLLQEININLFKQFPLKNKMFIEHFEQFLDENKEWGIDKTRDFFSVQATMLGSEDENSLRLKFQSLHSDFTKFLQITPRYPSADKKFIKNRTLTLDTSLSRDEIIRTVIDSSDEIELAQLALYTYRMMDKISWKPFLKAALEKNSVHLMALDGNTILEVFEHLLVLPNDSIYESTRLAQPDEVWNFQRGDGVEKAILLASFASNKFDASEVNLEVNGESVELYIHDRQFRFTSSKNLVLKKMRI